MNFAITAIIMLAIALVIELAVWFVRRWLALRKATRLLRQMQLPAPSARCAAIAEKGGASGEGGDTGGFMAGLRPQQLADVKRPQTDAERAELVIVNAIVGVTGSLVLQSLLAAGGANNSNTRAVATRHISDIFERVRGNRQQIAVDRAVARQLLSATIALCADVLEVPVEDLRKVKASS